MFVGPPSAFRALGLLAAATCAFWVHAQVPTVPDGLTNAAAVLQLSAAQAGERRPVTVRGVVTAAEADWKGQFFVQDETGGIFVENLNAPSPTPGDVVEVVGVTHPGAFAPIISSPIIRQLGSAPLPNPKVVAVDNLMAGIEDSLRVEVTGIVRSARIELGRLAVDLAVEGFRLTVYARIIPAMDPSALIAARVRVHGTAATYYHQPVRHLLAVHVYAPRAEDFTVLEFEPVDPRTQPVTPISHIAQYRYGSRPTQRAHIRGNVTHQRWGDAVYLQDETGGLRVEADNALALEPGTPIEAVGFIEYDNHLPLLRDAEIFPTAGLVHPLQPQKASFAEIRQGLHHGDFVTLRGHILDRVTRPVIEPAAGAPRYATTWLLQGDGLTFTAEFDHDSPAPDLAAIPIASTVDVDGVCRLALDTNGKLTSVRMLLPHASSMRVLSRPSWWTPRRLLIGLGLLGVGLLLLLGWLLTIAKKNATLRELIREIEQAHEELHVAHDTLEQKVEERSAQLQVEMTARKTSEVQFKAVLAERTRLARELHDSLEQTLTGIALRLNTAAKFAPKDPAAAAENLQLARNWLHQSQVDLRRSVWDLRSRELEQFDLARALRRSAEMLVDGSAIKLEFNATETTFPLPEIVEENVLRIGQEALTNIAKHAGATQIVITFETWSERLTLRIEDNGRGFDLNASAQAGAGGHFGLIGMQERAKRLSAQLLLESQPGQGTRLTLDVPFNRVNDRPENVALSP